MSKVSFAAFAVGSAILCAACGTNPTAQTEQRVPPVAPAPAPAPTKIAGLNPPVDARHDSTVTLTIPAGDSAIIMLGELKSVNQRIIISVPVRDKRKLTATLMPPDSLPNIHFSQLKYPDGKTEGPFGRNIAVATPQNGQYQLHIAHNLRAEGGLAKEFSLRVALTQ